MCRSSNPPFRPRRILRRSSRGVCASIGTWRRGWRASASPRRTGIRLRWRIPRVKGPLKNKAVIKVMTPSGPSVASRMKEVLEMLGEDPSREGLRLTPERYEKALRFLTGGYEESLEQIVNGALFRAESDEMVIVKDIEFFSLCEHHLLPFYGRIHVAYLPKERVIGLSKI